MAKTQREARGSCSTSENLYFPLDRADIWEKSLANFRLHIYRSEIFICEENWQKVEGR
ncbi:MAG: hypothetical protein F6K13_01350 [Okeania sp. SIO2B9]|nr:hypothetical protein [Okeania sp. SIO2B9]